MAAPTISQTLAASSDIFAKCTPAYGLGNPMCGSITEMDLSATAASELNSIYADGSGKLRILGALIEADFMGKACQIRQNTMYDYIQATARTIDAKRIGQTPLSRSLTEVNPFVRMHRKGLIQNNYWIVSNGSGAGGTSPTPGSAGVTVGSVSYDYTCRVVSQTGIPQDVRWFPIKQEIYITSQTGGGTTTRTQYRVVDTALSGGVLTLYCKNINLGSNLSGAKVTTPTTGFLTRGVSNVSPYESFGAQIPGINSNQLALYWIQDTRFSICIDEETNKYLDLLRQNNPYFREFGDVDSIELNRQILEDFQRREVETFLWNKPLPNQDPNNYGSLDVIQALDGANVSSYFYLPNVEGRNIARRANAVGVYEQLAECGRVYDLQNGVLNIKGLLDEIYNIHRARVDNQYGDKPIEIWMDMAYAVQFRTALFNYLNLQTGGILRVTMDLNDLKAKESPTGFTFTDYKLIYPAGVTLRVCTHLALDDLLGAAKAADTANSTSYSNGSRIILILHLGQSIYKSIIESASVNLQTGDLKTLASVNEDIFNRMAVLRKKIRHTGTKFTIVVECPRASLWLEGVAPTVPEWRGLGSSGGISGTLPGYTG